VRRGLDAFYAATAFVAAAATVLIMLVVFVQVGGRLLGLGIRGADGVVAWLTASACLSGAGYAFTRDSHVKVDLLVKRLRGGLQRTVAVAAALAALAISAYAAYACVLMVWESWTLGDVSHGDIAVKLWIPQLGVAVGAVALAVAVADALVVLLRGAAAAGAANPKSPLAEV
jgi:TRAP-type C4-dicarboxylate transport system permease small subunit